MAGEQTKLAAGFRRILLDVRPNRLTAPSVSTYAYRAPDASTRVISPSRVSLGTPSWWGPPVAGAPKPDHVLRGRVMQRDPETLEDTPRANIRVGLFYRRLMSLIDVQRSDSEGYVTFRNIMPGNQAYFGIAFDNADSPLQNSIIWDRLTPAPGP